jgi:serine/threonine protein kinase
MGPAVKLPEGTVIGNWRITQELGRGGQGVVWSARPSKTKRSPPRALKASFSENLIDRARFEREILLLGRCESPFVAPLLDSEPSWVARIDGVPPFAYYVTEKCEGSLEDLRDELGDMAARLRLFREACNAVAYLHALPEPIVHRDIKPANFLLAKEPRRLLLADFGIARELESASEVTRTHEVVGSPYFRAPEILRGGADSPASDVYSLGRLLEWLITGKVATDLEIQPVPRGGEFSDEACDALDRLLEKATAVPRQRYQSVRELLDALPELWLAPKPRATDSVGPSPGDIADAVALVRSNDQIGWRMREQELRRELPAHIQSWREKAEHAALKGEPDLFALIDELVSAAIPRFGFALTGVYAQVPPFQNQLHVLEELLALPDWKAGTRVITREAPAGLVYLLHHLHGALCCQLRSFDLALTMPLMTVARDSKHTQLVQQPGLTGWPQIFDTPKKADAAWRYLARLPDQFPMLFDKLFALRSDYEQGLLAYQMLMSLLELAQSVDQVSKLTPQQLMEVPLLVVPPMFMRASDALIRSAARRIFGNVDVVHMTALRAGTSREAVKRAWPNWIVWLERWRRATNQFPFFDDPAPLGELA